MHAHHAHMAHEAPAFPSPVRPLTPPSAGLELLKSCPRSGRRPPKPELLLVPGPDDTGRKIICRRCRSWITSSGQRIPVEGSHRHVFANPHGLVFEIGCFAHARGCVPGGPPSTEFAWFAGYSWQVAMCTQCRSHLGWLFTNPDGHRFWGLILAALEEEESRPGPA